MYETALVNTNSSNFQNCSKYWRIISYDKDESFDKFIDLVEALHQWKS